jgi:hypothetical protein
LKDSRTERFQEKPEFRIKKSRRNVLGSMLKELSNSPRIA